MLTTCIREGIKRCSLGSYQFAFRPAECQLCGANYFCILPNYSLIRVLSCAHPRNSPAKASLRSFYHACFHFKGTYAQKDSILEDGRPFTVDEPCAVLVGASPSGESPTEHRHKGRTTPGKKHVMESILCITR